MATEDVKQLLEKPRTAYDVFNVHAPSEDKSDDTNVNFIRI
jgi:hypothetical protein